MAKYLIFGASSGIGSSVCSKLALEGDTLVLVGRSEEKLEALRSSLAFPEKHTIISSEAEDPSNVPFVFDNATSDNIKLDGMVYCTGTVDVTPLRGFSVERAQRLFNVNFFSFAEAVSCYSKNKYSNAGSIVGISAANCHYPQKCMSMYSASKGAMEAAVRSMAIELADKNIRINCVIPGAVDTIVFKSLSDQQKDIISGKQLLGVSAPEDIAETIVFLLKNGSRVMTGRSMYVDGGLLGQ